MVRRRNQHRRAILRPLDPSDPRSWDHPSHREQWLELARSIGRQIARDEREGHSGPHIGGNDDDEKETGGNLR